LRDYKSPTAHLFKNTVKTNDWLDIETGLRGDYVHEYGFQYCLEFLHYLKLAPKFSSRLGGGLGYKTPTIFTEESESIQYQNVLPINSINLKKSYIFMKL
jgi:iron complex outermembrane receptor protein